MGDKMVESELFNEVAASNYCVIRNDWIGTMESYDKFIDVVNGCIMSFGGVIR